MSDMPGTIWVHEYRSSYTHDVAFEGCTENTRDDQELYIRADIHERRVSDLLEANNLYLERAREAEADKAEARSILEEFVRIGDLPVKKKIWSVVDNRARIFLAKIAERKEKQ